MPNDPSRQIVIAGQPVNVAGRKDLVAWMVRDCDEGATGKSRLVFDANGQGVSMRASDPQFRAAMDAADIVHADGEFIVKASQRFAAQFHIPNRSATTDMIHDFAAAAAKNGLSFFLFGGPPGLAEEAAQILVDRYPGLRIAGTRNGYFRPEEEENILAEINESGANIAWIGLGKPKEQLFCARHKGKFMPSWVVTCGGCFHYLNGDYGRAPTWMQKIGFEWLYRMFENPRALFLRYLSTTPHAFYLALTRSSAKYPSTRL